MKVLIGNFKGPQGEQGIEGKKGDTGEIGPRGSIWTSGTGITGISTIGAIFETSGITDAHLHDYYINTDTGNLYECIVPGAADVAEWVHVGNFKGPTGATGPAGSISNINEQKPTYEEASKLENINSGEIVAISFGKLKKALSVFLSHYMQKATTSILGHVKLSNSSAITKTGEYALDAIEKNAAVEGTLANLISQQNSNLATINATGLTKIGAVPWKNIIITNSGQNAVVFFSNWTGEKCFPENYGSGIILPCVDVTHKRILYIGRSGKLYTGFFFVSDKDNITWHN